MRVDLGLGSFAASLAFVDGMFRNRYSGWNCWDFDIEVSIEGPIYGRPTSSFLVARKTKQQSTSSGAGQFEINSLPWLAAPTSSTSIERGIRLSRKSARLLRRARQGSQQALFSIGKAGRT